MGFSFCVGFTLCLHLPDAYPGQKLTTLSGAGAYDRRYQENEYEERKSSYRPYNSFGGMVIRNTNHNDNQNAELNENENDADSANANAQRQVKSRANERFDINKPDSALYGGYLSGAGYSETYNTDTDDDTSGTDSETNSDGSISDSAYEEEEENTPY